MPDIFGENSFDDGSMAGVLGSASAGAQVGGPWGSLIGAGLGLAKTYAGAPRSQGGATAGPSRAESSSNSVFDSSGWVVNFGDGASIDATSQKASPIGALPWFVWAGVGLIAWKLVTRK